MSRILVVDDDPGLLRALRITLRSYEHEVDVAATGAAALDAAAAGHPDLVVLDLGLPDLDGLDVLRTLRAWTRVPVLVLSARTGESEKVAALDAGADDYVTKPFGMDELLARVRAALRRAHPAEGDEPVVHAAAFSVDLAAKRVRTAAGEDVRLTPTEWAVLELLVRHPGRLITQRQLLEAVWGPGHEGETHYLRVYLGHLRRKLEPDPAHPRHLLTEPRSGYRFEP